MRKVDVSTALQYGTAEGYPSLRHWVRYITRHVIHGHIPYKKGPEVIMTCGNTDGFNKVLQTFTDEWIDGRSPTAERPAILAERFSYPGALQTALARGIQVVAVDIDECGIVPDALDHVLANWNWNLGRRPHLLYTVAVGQNPTGSVVPTQRKKQIYDICTKYDVIIIEDEPYWFLQYPSAQELNLDSNEDFVMEGDSIRSESKSLSFPFLQRLAKSYLSIDVEGRVVRLDSFSKTVAPGCRLGWITAQKPIIEKLILITETSTQQPSGFVQSMVAQLLTGGKKDSDAWNIDGWIQWCENLCNAYQKRMEQMCGILDSGRVNVTTDSHKLSEWSVVRSSAMYDFKWPSGGMFVWVKMNYPTHPLFDEVGEEKLAEALWKYLVEKPYMVAVAPGAIFGSTNAIKKDDGFRYFRLCFAAVEESELRGITRRFCDGVREFWSLKKLPDQESVKLDAFLEPIN